jgi:uncharacterized Zn-finger protein
MTEEFDTDYTDEVVCPYCGHVHRESWELFADGEEDQEMICGECGRDFTATMNKSISYSSRKAEVIP